MLRRAVHRLAIVLAGTLILAASWATPAQSQGTTGKIQGRVVSAGGEPIAAAQVMIEGTTLGNITNDDGYYFINEVPAGLHNVRAQSIGYRAVVVQEQRVLAGQTTTINFTLEQTAVELEAITVEGERNPLVPRDQVSSKAIVTGEQIDRLPLDNSSSIIVLQPGVIQTNDGRSIRGSRPGEEAVFVDGVPIRRLRTGTTETVEVPTNALEQVDVTTGGISARFGNAQSGVINYVTRTGGPSFGGSVSVMTDELAPLDWRTGFNRGELSLGGPIPFIDNLTFFVGTTAEGRKYAALPQDFDKVGFWVASGVDTTFRVPRTSAVSGATDSVDVVVPEFVPWENGNRAPTTQSDEYNLTSKLTYGLPGGSKLDFTYYRNRNQNLTRGLAGLYNPDAWNGNTSRIDMFTLGGYFILAQSAEQALALDVKASYQNDFSQQGDVAKGWLQSHLDPAFGFNFSGIDFLMDPSDWPVSRKLVDLARSGVLPEDSLKILRRAGSLSPIQGVSGVAQPIRLNPYGVIGGLPGQNPLYTSGVGNTGQAYQREKRVYLSGTADWQMSRFNRLWIGGDVTLADVETINVPLTDGRLNAALFEPRYGGVFLQDRLDIGDVVLEAGLRLDYFDPSGDWPRTPGYVYNVPDSLKADFVRIRSGTEPILERVEPLVDCGGATTAPGRTRADGTVVCKNNFIKSESRTTLSPRLAVSFPVTASSTFRLSYGQNTQVPALTPAGGIFDDIYNDLQGGNANTNTTYGRDVEIPRTILFEAGYRQVFGGNTVVDVAAYSKTTRNALTYRKIQYRDPTAAGLKFEYLNSLTNSDYSLARGVDVRFDRRFSQIADLTVNYSFVDARGTGSDPTTYTGLILRRNTNLSILTGSPVEPPELLLTLDQSRAHNVAGTFSLLFPGDYMEGSIGNAILGDLGIFATMRVASGLPYTRLINAGNGQTGPPTAAGLGGIPAEDLNASRTPVEKRFDVRLTKGVGVGSNRLRLFADLRNPLGLANTSNVFLETGTTVNANHREKAIDAFLRDATLDGDSQPDDFDIDSESSDLAVNKYLLKQAEMRFGNGDGLFTVAEQTAAFESFYNMFFGPQWFRDNDRLLRLGLEFVF